MRQKEPDGIPLGVIVGGYGKTKLIKHRKSGRICKYPGCHQLLSVYNLDDFCYVHQRKLAAMSVKNETNIRRKDGMVLD